MLYLHSGSLSFCSVLRKVMEDRILSTLSNLLYDWHQLFYLASFKERSGRILQLGSEKFESYCRANQSASLWWDREFALLPSLKVSFYEKTMEWASWGSWFTFQSSLFYHGPIKEITDWQQHINCLLNSTVLKELSILHLLFWKLSPY